MSKLDMYERVLPLGEGGMGTVWLAKAPSGELVALKTLKDEHAADLRVRSMFLKEIRLASAIRHPNVVSVLATGGDEGTPWFVMEWVHGRSLRALAPRVETHGGVPLDIALRIAIDACAGLHAAHEVTGADGTPMGLVHRDVTPHNLVVSSTGVTKVIDFGVAKAREAVGFGDTTTSGGVKGKVRYMAPEQALARPLDRRADIFALGAVLFELVVGRPPFEGPNDLAILRVLLGAKSVDVPAWVPAPITDVLKRALARRPDDRFATIDDMGVAIARAMFELGLSAGHLDVARWVKGLEPALTQDPRGAEMTHADLAADLGTGRGTPTPFIAIHPAVAAERGKRGKRIWFGIIATAIVLTGVAGASVGHVDAALAQDGPRPPSVATQARQTSPHEPVTTPTTAAPTAAPDATTPSPTAGPAKKAVPATAKVHVTPPPIRAVPAAAKRKSADPFPDDATDGDLATALRERR